MRSLVPLVGLLLTTPALAADTYDIDPVHSSVLFSTLHLNAGRFFGTFENTTGTFSIDEANPAASTISITVKTASVDSNDAKRDAHQKSPDFFNAAQFPTITFVSKSVTKTGDKYSVTGDFTLHGVTKTITADFTKTGEADDPYGGHRAGWYSEFTIERSDYGMTFMSPGVGDEVKLIVAVEGTRKK
jgi:polyisoprenoid-binding protein YceI